MSLTITQLPHNWDEVVPNLLSRTLVREGIDAWKFARQVLIDPNFRRDGALCAWDGEQLVGFCLAIKRRIPLENAPSDEDRGYITLLAVDPDAERRGIGGALLREAEGWLAGQGARFSMVSPYAPGYFAPGVDNEAYPSGKRFFEKHGYTEVYRPLAMQCDLWDLKRPDWVNEAEARLIGEGVAFSPFHPRLTLPLMDFATQDFGGDWIRWVREGISDISKGDTPSRLVVASVGTPDGPRVLGFSHFCGERFGPIGVGTTERGRGLGQVLMFMTLEAQKALGMRASWFLWSEDRTAERLYNVAGFREIRRFSLFKKEL